MKPNRDFRITMKILIVVGIFVFSFGGLLSTAYAYDEYLNRANANQYEEYASRIAVGMTKSQVISRIGNPVNVNRGKDNEELWWWQSNHRWKYPLIYRLVGKSAYYGGPYLRLAFDDSSRVLTVEMNRVW
jgi:outer membrane protein assembly factor BamE (lipoprotein component of BamABCDE complex)